jgi:hypothetical protein
LHGLLRFGTLPLRESGRANAPTPTGDYAPSLRSPWRAAGEVAREVVGAEKLVDFTTKPDLLERLAKRIGASAGEAMAAASGLNRFPLR